MGDEDRDASRGARRRAPPLQGELILEVDELRQSRAALWRMRREQAVRLRELLPRIIAAGYSQRAAGKLLGISYATVQIIVRGKRAGKAGKPK